MYLDPMIIVAGFVVGTIVGVTGVGGGSLMTPFLIFYGISPVLAVGTDLLFAAITKITGVFSYHRRQWIKWRIVGYLLVGSLPGSILSLWYLHHLDSLGQDFDVLVTRTLSISLVLTAVVLFSKNQFFRSRRDTSSHFAYAWLDRFQKPLTVLAGFIMGVLVSISSIGAGALGAAILVLLYPRIRLVKIIGTDLAHAVPLTAFSGLGHVQMGNVDFGLLGALLIGSIPGIILGARLAAHLSENFVRNALATMLLFLGANFFL